MSRFRRLLPLVVLAGAAAVLIPTLASGQSPSSASFTAIDSAGVYGSHSWQASSGGNSVTITQGGTVSFSYSTGAPPQGSSTHNVDFTSGPATPTCTQTQPASSSGPPMPASPSSAPWAGHCTFTTAGTYQFWCDLHMSAMTGTVVVTSTGSSGATGSTPTPSTSTPASGTEGSMTPASPALEAVAVAASQKGTAVRGMVKVGQAGSALAVTVTASTASLAKRHQAPTTTVGRLTRSGVGPGKVAFRVKLNGRAQRALRRRGHLALSLRITVTAPTGASTTRNPRTVLHP